MRPTSRAAAQLYMRFIKFPASQRLHRVSSSTFIKASLQWKPEKGLALSLCLVTITLSRMLWYTWPIPSPEKRFGAIRFSIGGYTYNTPLANFTEARVPVFFRSLSTTHITLTQNKVQLCTHGRNFSLEIFLASRASCVYYVNTYIHTESRMHCRADSLSEYSAQVQASLQMGKPRETVWKTTLLRPVVSQSVILDDGSVVRICPFIQMAAMQYRAGAIVRKFRLGRGSGDSRSIRALSESSETGER